MSVCSDMESCLIASEVKMVMYQYNKTNMLNHFFSLLRLIDSTGFKRLFAHHQEVLYIQQLVHFLRIMSAAC
jgi:hypothetical protein